MNTNDESMKTMAGIFRAIPTQTPPRTHLRALLEADAKRVKAGWFPSHRLEMLLAEIRAAVGG